MQSPARPPWSTFGPTRSSLPTWSTVHLVLLAWGFHRTSGGRRVLYASFLYLELPQLILLIFAQHGIAQSPGVNFASFGNFSYATSFPQPILMGAAFDDALIQAVASVVSTEARAFNNVGRGGLDYWTPNINRKYPICAIFDQFKIDA